MLQFYDRIVPKCGFVDLHNHTNDSYGEEMNRMSLSPEELLESVYEYTQINNANATFSITDHNSIEGVQKVDLLMKSNPKKYEKINFISGVEFTCSAGSLGEIKNDKGHIKNIFSNFHMLAYGFNPFDDELSFLCKLHSTKKINSIIALTTKGTPVKISAGAYVLSIKNILKDYGIRLSLKDFKDVNLKTDGLDEKTYVQYLMTYIEKFKLTETIKKDIFYQLCNRNIISLGRLDCLEVMEIVEKAGGYCVLAHPFLIKLGSYASNNKTKTNNFLKRMLTKFNVPFKQKDSIKVLAMKYVINKLSKSVKSISTNQNLTGIVGIEALHVSSTLNYEFFEKVVEIAKENNLYITCGSDSHGTLKSNMLSNFTAIKNVAPNTKNNIVAKNCLFSSRVLDGTIKQNIKCKEDFDDQICLVHSQDSKENIINLQDYCKLITSINAGEKSHKKTKQDLNEEKTRNIEFSKIISSGMANLNTMIFLMKKTLNSNSNEKIVKDYKKIKSFQPSVTLALETINANKNYLKSKKYVLNFLKTYTEYLNLKSTYKKRFNDAIKQYKKEKKEKKKQQKSLLNSNKSLTENKANNNEINKKYDENDSKNNKNNERTL